MPSGTVTFLFTDIEGSTQLWERRQQAMQAPLARHDALLRQAVLDHNGQIVKMTGDGCHAAFAGALDGALAALQAQQTLSAESWPEIAPDALRVRMGLYAGEAEPRAGDYYGSSVNRAARLMSAAHGGQILVSGAAADLVRDRLPASAALRDLSEHRLKDLARPERVLQLTWSMKRWRWPERWKTAGTGPSPSCGWATAPANAATTNWRARIWSRAWRCGKSWATGITWVGR